jgi:ubiquinone/menaquinone biosynthesis C-methylase UbiE
MGMKAWLDAEIQVRLGKKEAKIGFDETRRRALALARGRVLEIGAGTGANLGRYPDEVGEVVLTEPQKYMARKLRAKLPPGEGAGRLLEVGAEALPFEDGSFDTVVSTLVLCTVPDQQAALAEARRVLAPGGRLVFLEHVRSDDPKLARWQDRLNRPWRRLAGGCNCNRSTLAAIEAAGFTVGEVEHGTIPKAPPWIKPLILGWALR